jgi:co-chaperonin GroES (HSP10)
MNVLPLKDRVLVAENKKNDTTASGIIIEGVRTGETARATILAVGPDVTEVKVGDVVLIDWSKASPVRVGDVQRAMLKEEDILAVFE